MTGDLKVAGRNAVEEEVRKIVEKDPNIDERLAKHSFLNQRDAIGKSVMANLRKYDLLPTQDNIEKFIKMQYANLWLEAATAPIDTKVTVALRAMGTDKELRENITKALKAKGYNAMSDLGGVGGRPGTSREGVDPLLVFDSSNVVEKIKTRKNGALGRAVSRIKYNEFKVRANTIRNDNAAWSNGDGTWL